MTQRSQLRDEAASYIRSLILSRQLAPGSYVRLDPLADELGISVTPVREALMTLREQGFVDLLPNRGFVVLQISPADVADLFLVQAFAAGELAARATEIAPDDVLDELDRYNDELEHHAQAGSGRAFELVNDEFHALVNDSADSPRLAWFYVNAIPIIPRRFLSLVPGWAEMSLRDHRAIVASMRRRDPKAARQAMSEHIAHAGQAIARHLDGGGEWPGSAEHGPSGAQRARGDQNSSQ
jgi:DNA-binding GntR family transcriptional regulator